MSETSVSPDQVSTFFQYKGVNVLSWPSHIDYRLILTQYQQVPTIAVRYTASSPSNAQLGQLDLVEVEIVTQVHI